MADQLNMWIEAVIRENYRKRSVVRVISTEEKALVTVGDNYMSQVKKLVVRAVRGDGQIVTESFILKLLPSGAHTRELVQESGFCFIEFTSYRDVLPAMDLLLKEKEIPDEPLWAHCLGMKPYDRIIFEDLTACGYKMADRLQGLDFDHCKLIVQSLSLFHSLSLVLKEKGGLSNVVFGQHSTARNVKEYKGWIENGYKSLLKTMEKWGDEWQPALKKMKEKLPDYADHVINLYQPLDNGFTVLNHGDCWTNNCLFKYNAYSGKPVFVRFLDYQISFLCTPAHDLTYLFASSPNSDVRRHHEKDLVRIYHDSLLFNMNRLGVTVKPPSLEYIESEMKRLTYFRICLMTTLVMLITRKPEDTLNIDTILEQAKEANLNGGEISEWIADVDDHLLQIYQDTIKGAEDEGTL